MARLPQLCQEVPLFTNSVIIAGLVLGGEGIVYVPLAFAVTGHSQIGVAFLLQRFGGGEE